MDLTVIISETVVLAVQSQVPLAIVTDDAVVAHVVEEIVQFGNLVLANRPPKEVTCHGIDETAATISDAVESLTGPGRKTGAAVGAVVGPEGAVHFVDRNIFNRGQIFTAELTLVLRQDVNGVVDLPPLVAVAMIRVLVIEEYLDNVVGLDCGKR